MTVEFKVGFVAPSLWSSCPWSPMVSCWGVRACLQQGLSAFLFPLFLLASPRSAALFSLLRAFVFHTYVASYVYGTSWGGLCDVVTLNPWTI